MSRVDRFPYRVTGLALIARPSVFEPGGREFESLRARHLLLTGHVADEGGSAFGSRPPQIFSLICRYV